MTQQEFLKLLQNKYKFNITGYGEKAKEIDIQINPNDKYAYYLIPYTKRTLRNNIYVGKDGEPFTTKTFNYTIKDNQTGEITHSYISKSKVLFTTLYQRDLIILDKTNKYDKKLALNLAQYEIVKQKRLPLFYRVNEKTFLQDMKGNKSWNINQ